MERSLFCLSGGNSHRPCYSHSLSGLPGLPKFLFLSKGFLGQFQSLPFPWPPIPERLRFHLIWQILFILVDADEPRNRHIFKYFRITEVNIPCVQILNLSSDARYKMPSEEITYENLKKFGRSFLNRSAKVSLFLDKVYSEPQNFIILLTLVI